METERDRIVARVVAAREDPQATDHSELWRKAIAKVSPPSPVAGALGHEPAPVANAPAAAPAPAAMDIEAMWARAKAKASAPVIAQLRAMGLR